MLSRHTSHPSRYSVGGSENEYMDRKRKIMKNLKGVRSLRSLQKAEEDALVVAYDKLFSTVRSDTPMTVDLLKHVHNSIFVDLYTWAGKFRTVAISKPGVTWPPPDYLEEAMRSFERNILRKYSAHSLNDDERFCEAVGHVQGEFLAIHPFREGNARTIKLFTDLLAAQLKRPILRYDMTKEGQRQYIDAAKAALLKQNYIPMQRIIEKALRRSTLLS
ncbi:hypothetical protein A3H22_04510 [Candidatus Peribacteria bacterium RIFCSPLOWO2_12_FULL_55_15]|nr:MAG: hypothetical protein A2789_01925 [Candidatus Peribacteria bacterium RIFCSPHIGHO2_01_FULL_54_22]OGJ62324.1 MAG: hypothetical protein A3D12_02185 [Candidatus Peribacteria bacterium RIFCSPHIGHO2_02_FULL_55_24]OGJ64909.1 MAG: hypothetical protein A3E47_00765 [Candidatus Peribacteria bacterium RIFCSPHIGHO2_12_FULL_54_10]OGJ67721.1 MAG: hypothetical protein A2947_03330 [Candidatus Peribacteria bacterium RIFCSPLOWO2_01_FULL_54_110]OGJ68905.1 MAG: hypothetical protein A3H90_02020 [Candidatus Pe